MSYLEDWEWPDERPIHRLTTRQLISVDYNPRMFSEEELQVECARFTADGWESVNSYQQHQFFGMPYRVEYWGYK